MLFGPAWLLQNRVGPAPYQHLLGRHPDFPAMFPYVSRDQPESGLRHIIGLAPPRTLASSSVVSRVTRVWPAVTLSPSFTSTVFVIPVNGKLQLHFLNGNHLSRGGYGVCRLLGWDIQDNSGNGRRRGLLNRRRLG